jgi:UDPglucose--hexose-1-phosphate uridylyltransferase
VNPRGRTAKLRSMSEFRQDRTSGHWVIVAPQRSRRPQMRRPDEQSPARPRFDPSCPFCPGNEAQLPGIVAEVASPDVPGWRARIVPNKFPAVMAAPPEVSSNDHRVLPSEGVQEVMIESPWHDADPATMKASELAAVVAVYRERMRILLDRDDIEAAVLFRNYGHRAGASLAHPHAQLIALPMVPARVAGIGEWAKQYHREHGRCPMCEELAVERQTAERIIDENEAFTALVPFAAEHPCEVWVVPKRHQASFTALSDEELPAFADMLGRSLARLQTALNDPPYNFVIDTAPKRERAAPFWHWRLRIVPDVATWGGFELGSGLPINPSRPEDDARLLRDIQLR